MYKAWVFYKHTTISRFINQSHEIPKYRNPMEANLHDRLQLKHASHAAA